jgi:hypothetical protein
MVEEANFLSRASFMRALISVMRALLSWPNHLPKVPPPNPITIGGWVSAYNFFLWVETQTLGHSRWGNWGSEDFTWEAVHNGFFSGIMWVTRKIKKENETNKNKTTHFFYFFSTVSLCSVGCPWTCDLPASPSQVLGLQASNVKREYCGATRTLVCYRRARGDELLKHWSLTHYSY